MYESNKSPLMSVTHQVINDIDRSEFENIYAKITK